MWIESHQSIRNHPKIKKAARLAGINEFEMIGRLHCLWWWALDYAPDGDVTKYTADDIESAVDWTGERGSFYSALTGCGFNGHCGLLEQIDGIIIIHDWHEYGGRLLEKREANKERMRAKRASHVQNTTTARAGATEQTEQTEQLSSYEEPADEKKPRKKSDRQIAVDELENRFATLSGLQKPNRDKAKGNAAARWWVPLGEMWELCGKETERTWKLIEAAYKKLNTEKMTISAPQSVLNTAIALYAQSNGNKTIKLTGVVNA